jgi:predicted dehydrogenase
MQYRVAIVGAGGIAGHRHMPAIREQGDRIEVVAAVDVDGDRAAAFATEWGIPDSYTDLDTMLAATRPDLAIICTPPVAHRAGVAACLAAGAWVWCEKPPVLSLAEYDALAALEREGGPYVGYVFQHRFGSAARTLRAQTPTGRSAGRSSASATRSGTATTPTSRCRGAGSGRPRAAARRWATASTRWTSCCRCWATGGRSAR